MLLQKTKAGWQAAEDHSTETVETVFQAWDEASPEATHLSLPNTLDVLTHADRLRHAHAVQLHFPAFGDGRAYSQARLLRERLGFSGEIRATGAAVVRDQIHFMARCGFDALLLRDDQDVAVCLAAFDDFDQPYQPAVDAVLPVWQRRRIGQ
jgi:uncharacterized protein (DUF934 family)